MGVKSFRAWAGSDDSWKNSWSFIQKTEILEKEVGI